MMRTKLFNRDSQDIPENRLMPILTGMSEEERVLREPIPDVFA
jgi:hypothetical protein